MKHTQIKDENKIETKSSINPILRKLIFLFFGILLIGFVIYFELYDGKAIVIGGLPLVFGLFCIKEAIFPYKKV